MAYSFLRWFIYSLCIVDVYGTYNIECSDAAEGTQVANAIKEAGEVLAYALLKLASPNDPVVKGALNPMFDVTTDLGDILGKVAYSFDLAGS
jgi:hypothetical protein